MTRNITEAAIQEMVKAEIDSDAADQTAQPGGQARQKEEETMKDTEIEGIIYSTEANGIEIIHSDSDSMTYALTDKTVKIVWGYAGAGEGGLHTSYDAFAEAECSDGECLYYRVAGELNDDHFYTWCDAAAHSLLTGETDLPTVTEG